MGRMSKYGLVSLMAVLAACGGEDADFVARIGREGITAGEFRDRYETYLTQVGQRDNIKLRKEILTNMINERLIMADLERRDFDQWPESVERRDQMLLQAMLDRYSKLISIDTITLTEQEFRDEFRAYNSKASVRYLYAPTEAGAWHLKEMLEGGSTFEELARRVFDDPGLANNGGYVGSFGWGEMEPVFEQEAFSLPLGEVSDPFPMKIGYGIMRVESRVRQPLASEYDYAKARPKLGQAILSRRTMQAISTATRELAVEADPVFDAEGVGIVLANWDFLSGTVPLELSAEFNFSGHPLVTFNGGNWNIGEFSEKVRRTSERQRKRVRERGDIEDVIAGLIVREELLRRAYDEGLEGDPDVVAQSTAVYYQYKLKSWGGMVKDSALAAGWDEAELRREYEQRKELHAVPPEVNVAEVLVRTKDEASSIARRAQAGEDFSALARDHSIRLWAAERGGELGYGTIADFGFLGEKFMETKHGEIIGPEFVDPYFGVFKILAKKESRVRSFEEARPIIIESLGAKREHTALLAAVRDLRSETAGIEIDMEILANIRIEHADKGKAS